MNERKLDEIREALEETLVIPELEDALAVLAEALEAEVGFYRFPRPSIGDGGKRALSKSTRGDVLIALNDVPMGERGACGLVITRDKKLSRAELEQVQAAAKLFSAATRRIARFEAVSGQNSGLTALIEGRLGACAALASPRGEMLWMSQSARDILGEDGRAMLTERVRGEIAELVKEQTAREFVINVEGKKRIFGSMLFVRPAPDTSVHYIGIELHGSDVESDADEAKLTRSEREVFKLLKQGLDNDEIAKARFVTVETVRSHIKAIFRKTGATSRVDLLTRRRRDQ